MQWKRFGRCLICLLVVVALLINMVPQKAEASGLGMAAAGAGTLVAAPSLPVIAAIVMGLGVLVAVSTVDWDSVVRKCQNYLINKGVIDEEGNIQIVKFDFSDGGSVDGSNGPIFENAIGFAASQSLIEMIRDWLFEEEIVYQNSDVGIVYDDVFYTFPVWDSETYPYAVLRLSPSGNYLYFHVSNAKFSSKYSGSQNYLSVSSGQVHCIAFAAVGDPSFSDFGTVNSGPATFTDTPMSSLLWSNHDISFSPSTFYSSDPISSSSIISSYDVTLGEIASPETSLDEGYSTWYGNAISVPGSDVGSDDDYVPYWPIGLGQTYAETQTFTQEQIWAGESTYVDTSTDTGTDTDTGVITGTFADTLVGDFLISLGEIIMTPFEWLLEGIKAIFVPSEDFLSAKVEALRTNFLFADSIITAWESLRSAFTEFETEPPVIYMELSNSESDIDYGSRAIALDLTWYERYKPTVDTLLSSLLWIWFVWRVFRKLPGIISGMPGDTPDVPVSDGHFYGYAEGRKRLPGGSIKRR